jgi:asparagine synthase (glutamine-hydrolysing)
MLYVDYKTWLVDDILVKIDRASMAYGLEIRSPFMDHRLFEFCATLPPERKARGGTSKVILREAAREIVPQSIRRRSKKGFNAPVSHWIAGSWRDVVEEHLGDRKLRQTGVLNPLAVRTLLHEHRSGRRDHGYLLFALLQLTLWLDKTRPALPQEVPAETRRRAA